MGLAIVEGLKEGIRGLEGRLGEARDELRQLAAQRDEVMRQHLSLQSEFAGVEWDLKRSVSAAEDNACKAHDEIKRLLTLVSLKDDAHPKRHAELIMSENHSTQLQHKRSYPHFAPAYMSLGRDAAGATYAAVGSVRQQGALFKRENLSPKGDTSTKGDTKTDGGAEKASGTNKTQERLNAVLQEQMLCLDESMTKTEELLRLRQIQEQRRTEMEQRRIEMERMEQRLEAEENQKQNEERQRQRRIEEEQRLRLMAEETQQQEKYLRETKELAEAVREQAEREAKAIRTKAKTEADALRVRAEGEADNIRRRALEGDAPASTRRTSPVSHVSYIWPRNT